jgi:hypothetical protein
MAVTTTNQSSLDRVRELFAAEGLPFPPLPADVGGALQEVAPNVFSTRQLEASPYNLRVYSFEIQTDPAVPNYAVVGFDGHGINSWAVHYYLVEDALALFVQLAWGGAYVEPDEATRAIKGVFAWAEKLQAEVRRARSDGLIPPGWRLLVVVSQFAESGWAFVPSPPPGPEAIEWHDGGDLRAAIDKSLADLRAGRLKLG